MPILKHAIKKKRQDHRRTEINKLARTHLKSALKKNLANPADQSVLSTAFCAIDRAAKHHIIHRRKADRIKSRLTKKLAKAAPAKTAKKPAVKRGVKKKIAK